MSGRIPSLPRDANTQQTVDYLRRHLPPLQESLEAYSVSALADHISDVTAAHAATAISNSPAGGIAATTVQAAINELDTEKQPLNANLTALAALALTGKTMTGGSYVDVEYLGRGVPVTKTGDFTVSASENWLINNKAGSTCTATLPAAASFPGRELMLTNNQAQALVSASSNVVPITGGAASTAILAATSGKWATLVSDGANWLILQAN